MEQHKITTTLAKIRACRPCGLLPNEEGGYNKLKAFLGNGYGDDTPVTFAQIYESNGRDDTLWCLRSVPECSNIWRYFAVDCAEMVEHLMTDERSKNALCVARRHADGQATDEELAVAWDAAGDADAAWDAAAACYADRAAAGAAQMRLLFEYCRTGERVNWREFLGQEVAA